MLDNIEKAAIAYLRRKNRKDHPEGKFDKKKWYPSVDEKCSCCNNIRNPSNAHPYSLMLHCRTLNHIANLYEIKDCDIDKLKLVIKNIPFINYLKELI